MLKFGLTNIYNMKSATFSRLIQNHKAIAQTARNKYLALTWYWFLNLLLSWWFVFCIGVELITYKAVHK